MIAVIYRFFSSGNVILCNCIAQFGLLFFLQCFDTVGWVTGRAFSLQKNWVLVCRWWQFDWSFTRLIAPVVTITSITLSSNKIQNGDILLWANPGPPGHGR